MSLRNFIAKQNARQTSQKRGGGQRPVDFDEAAAEQRLALAIACGRTPSELFERDWALTLLEQALDRLEAEQRAMGKAGMFARLRQRYRALVRAEIMQTLADAADLDDEVRHLFSILRS